MGEGEGGQHLCQPSKAVVRVHQEGGWGAIGWERQEGWRVEQPSPSNVTVAVQ